MTTPSGALRSYRRAVSVLAVGQLVNWAALYFAFTSFVLPMQSALGWSKPLLMGAFTLGLVVWAVATPFVGAAIDRGAGRHVLTIGAALGGAVFLAWSRVSEPWMLYATFTGLGIAMAMTLYEPAFAVLTRRFPGRYRDGITTLTLVGGFASTLSFPAAAWLMQAFGWRAALGVIGAVLLVVIAPLHAWALRGSDALAPQPPPSPAQSKALELPAVDATLNSALRTSGFWLLTATFAGYSFAAAALWAHVVPALAAKGIDETHVLAVLVWIGPTQVASRVLFKFFGSRLAPRHIGFAVFAAQALAFAVFAIASSEIALIGFAMLFGAASGLAAIVRGQVVPAYFGVTNIGRIGGVMSSFALYARAAAPIAAAALLAWPMGYDAVMWVLAGVSLLALAAYAGAKRPPIEHPEFPPK